MKQDLIDIVLNEFKSINIPVLNQSIRSNYDYVDITRSPSDPRHYSVTLELVIQSPHKYADCFQQIARSVEYVEIPFRSFDDMEHAFSLNANTFSHDFPRDKFCRITVLLELNDRTVYDFIKFLREKTEPIKLDMYNKEFDKEVESHLSNNEGNNGY